MRTNIPCEWIKRLMALGSNWRQTKAIEIFLTIFCSEIRVQQKRLFFLFGRISNLLLGK